MTSIEEARETFETTDLRERMGRYHRDAERTFRLWNDIWLAPEFRSWNIEDVLGAVTAPALRDPGRARPVRDARADRGDRARRQRSCAAARCSTAATRRSSRRRRRRWWRRPRSSGGSNDAAVEDSFVVPFERSFDAHYGLEYLSAGDGEARGRVVVTAAHLGADGTVQSGVYASMAESLASTGTAVEVVPQGPVPVRFEQLDACRRRRARRRARGRRPLPRPRRAGVVVGRRDRPARRRAAALSTVAIAIRPVRPKKTFEPAATG